MSRVTFSGWIDDAPAVADRDATGTPPRWRIRTLALSGWLMVGELPDGSSPISDGDTFANVPDPETGPDLALLESGGAIKHVTMPDAAWVRPWRETHGVVPLVGRSGYLLVGAGAISIVDDQGEILVTPVPDGFVALAPTSDAQQYLLASTKDASEPGGLSESTSFAAFLWTIGSSIKPLVVGQAVVSVMPSSVGLAWLRSNDGSWWSLTGSGSLEQGSQPTPERSVISPDGQTMVRFSDTAAGCAQDAPDQCIVFLIDDAGSIHPFVGPASGGASFRGSDVGIVLGLRPVLRLPWRLVFGPATAPTTTTIE